MSEEKQTKPENLDALLEDRVYFAPAEIEKAHEFIAKVESIPNVKVRRNFSDENIPDGQNGYGVLIYAIRTTDKEKKERRIDGVAICAVPSLETVRARADGEEWITDAVMAQYAIKLNNAIKPKGDGKVSATLPYSIDDFLGDARSKEAFKLFSQISGKFVAYLQDRGLKTMTKPVLRQVLQSKQAAEKLYPKIAQSQWEGTLKAMISYAEQQLKKDASTLKNWLETRNQVTEVQDEDVTDFGDINSLVSQEAAD